MSRDPFDSTQYAPLRHALCIGGDNRADDRRTRSPEEHETIILAKRAAIDLARKVGRLDADEDNYGPRVDCTGDVLSAAETRANLQRAIREAFE